MFDRNFIQYFDWGLFFVDRTPKLVMRDKEAWR